MKTLRIKNWAGAAVTARLSAVAAGVLLVCAAVSCKKDGGSEPTPAYNVRTFQATNEGHAGDGKTTLDKLAVKWMKGDAVAVCGDGEGSGWVEFKAASGGASSTTLNAVGAGSVSGSEFYAIYPNSAVSGTGVTTRQCEVKLPKYQVSESGQTGTFVSGANVMAAMSADQNTFQFKNLCGVLRLKLGSQPRTVVRSIQVVTRNNESLWGTYDVEFKDGDARHTLNYKSGGDNSVCLVYPDGVDISGKVVEFDIVVPAGTLKGGFDLEVYCEYGDGKKGVYFTSANQSGFEITVNRINAMDALSITADDISEGVLPGRFNTGNDVWVHFSQGNLQCMRNGNAWVDENVTWQFAKNQYDIVEQNDDNIGNCYSNSDVVSLFGWGTSGKAYRVPKPDTSKDVLYYQPWKTTNDQDYGPVFNNDANGNHLHREFHSDWGCNEISNGGDEEWRTPSGGNNGEWIFLVSNRDGAKYANAVVMEHNGLLLFPDGLIVETGNKTTCGGIEIFGVNNAESGSIVNRISSLADWSALESAGVVFLPCAGERLDTKISNVGTVGEYWSSTAGDAVGSYALENATSMGYSRVRGFSVRLVR